MVLRPAVPDRDRARRGDRARRRRRPAKPRTRLELTFVAFFGAFFILVLAAATKPGAEKQEFKERYLFALIALAPIAYGFYIRNARPLRPVAIAVAALIAIAAARQPLTEYATATFKTDSQFLFAISESQNRFGAGTSSLIVALLATLGAVIAVLLAFRGNLAIPFGISIAVALVATVVATRVDIRGAREVRAQLPADLSWVDNAAHGGVTAIETQDALKPDLLSQLYWNTSIHREVLLGSANATDAFSAPKLVIGPGGRLEKVQGDVLVPRLRRTGQTRRRAGAGCGRPVRALASERRPPPLRPRRRALLGRVAQRLGPDQGLALAEGERRSPDVPTVPADGLAQADPLGQHRQPTLRGSSRAHGRRRLHEQARNARRALHVWVDLDRARLPSSRDEDDPRCLLGFEPAQTRHSGLPDGSGVRRLLALRGVKTVATLAISGLCLAYIVWRIDVRRTVHLLGHASLPYFLAATATFVLAVIPMAWRWQRLLAARGVHDNLGWLTRTYFVSYAVGQVLPTSLGGDASRIFETSRRHRTAGQASAGSVLVERALGGAATLTLAGVGFVLAIGHYDVGPYLWIEALLAVATVVLAVLLFSRRARQRLSWLGPLLARTRIERPLRTAYEGVHAYRNHVRLLTGAFALTLFVQTCRIAAIWMVGKSVGVQLSPRPYYVMGPMLFLVMLVPFTINGIALREAFFVSFLGKLSIGADPAFATGFLFFLLSVLVSVPGAAILLVEAIRRGRRRPARRSEAASETQER